MKLKLKNTRLVDEYKRPIPFFHTSPVGKIEYFLPLSHFGTKRAADIRSMHFVYQTLGMQEPAVLPDKLPHAVMERFLKTKEAPQLFTYSVFLHSKSSLKIPDLGKHSLYQYQRWFKENYAPKPKFLTGKERLEGDGVGETKTAYKKALTEFIFVDPFKQPEENLRRELSAESFFKTPQNASDLPEKVALQRMMRFLEGEGYDSFVYKNDYEDKGKESYIIFRPEQIFAQNTAEAEHIIPPADSLLLSQTETKFFKEKQILSPSERISQQIHLKKTKTR